MRILYIYTDLITWNDIPWGLLELGYDVVNYDDVITLQEYREEEQEKLSLYLRRNDFAIVISHNFSEAISCACQESGIKYVSWVFDSPQWELYKPAVNNSCNYIFVFDKAQFIRMKEKKLPHLFYMPLATNISRTSGICIEQEDIDRYSCDISFIGRLYSDNDYNRDAARLPQEIKEYFNYLIYSNSMKWDQEHRVIGSIGCEWHQVLSDWIHLPLKEKADQIYFMEVCYLTRKIAEIERVCVLNALALKHEVHCYTSDDTYNLEGVIVHPPVRYGSISPKVFHLSKINLNITLRSIETGIPQRVFDIMGAGGFVLMNYQEEAEELFVPDQEVVLFRDIEELVYKVNYYLKHEKERLTIAMNGYQRVKKEYNYRTALSKMLNLVWEE